MPNKYESVFDLRNNRIKSSVSLIQEGWNYYINKNHEKMYQMNSNLICPECMQAHLEVAIGLQRQYIKKLHNSEHENDCYFNIEVSGKRELRKYFSDKNPLTIEHELGHLLDSRLILRNNNDERALDSVRRTHSEMVFHPENSNDNVRKRVPQRKINNSLIDILNNSHVGDIYGPAYFYGNVLIDVKYENESHKNYKISLPNNDDFEITFGIYKGKEHVIQMLDNHLDNNYMIAFKAEIEINGKENNKFFDVHIDNEHYLVIR